MLKKMLPLTLASFMAISAVSACGGGDDEDDDDEEEVEESEDD